MWIILLPMLAQVPADRAILDAEHARAAGAPALLRSLTTGDRRTQRLAARALGRLENPAHREALLPLLDSPDAGVRAAAIGALAQLRASYPFGTRLPAEPDATVRAAMYEAIGRAKEPVAGAEADLAAGLRDRDVSVRVAAARGLEAYFRLGGESRKPAAATLSALSDAFTVNTDVVLRQLALLIFNRARSAPPALVSLAQKDARPEVRRLVVRFSPLAATRDLSPMVRYEALRFAPTCGDVVPFLSDADEAVQLGAIEALGRRSGCDATLSAPLVRGGRTWRIRAHALVWARLPAADAARAVREMARDTIWQVRVAVATAARMISDTATTALLLRDPNPNVVIAAMTSADEAVRNLRSDHAGLALAAANLLKNQKVELTPYLSRIVSAYNRLAADGTMTTRDPRAALLGLIGSTADTGTNGLLRDALSDRDPAIAADAAKYLSQRSGTTVAPVTTQLPIPPIPPAAYIRGLAGATARITMRGLGVMTVALLTEEAPVTVGVFAQLAESGQYNGLTFHRIVPNFVIQGGSPGADEYDGRTREFLRDEVGFARQVRGSIGISTRGRDTGDGQIYFNLVDNYRLDREYTTMATMRTGLSVMDRVQEGDVIERVEIIRRGGATRARRR